MKYRVNFSIVLEEELKKGDWNPETTKSEYTRKYTFDNDIDAINHYRSLRRFGDCSNMYKFINDEKYFGLIYRPIAGMCTIIYIEKWEGFDDNLTIDVERNGFHCSSEYELLDKLIEEKGLSNEELIKHNMPLFICYVDEGYLLYGYGSRDYCAKSTYKYKNLVIFGEEPMPTKEKKEPNMSIPF